MYIYIFIIFIGDKDKVRGGNGKVLESGPDDEVFLFYSDHGNVGLVGMPSGGYLYADELLKTLKYMHDNQKYNRLTYYLNACMSGSMFEDLPDNLNIIAMTAANRHESGHGCFCPPYDHVGVKYHYYYYNNNVFALLIIIKYY